MSNYLYLMAGSVGVGVGLFLGWVLFKRDREEDRRITAFSVYKTILNSVAEPVCQYDFEAIESRALELQGADGESDNLSYAIAESALRAARYVRMSIAILEEGADD